jgi:hypothetical protein
MLAYGFNPTLPDNTGGNLTKVPSMNLPGISADDSLMLLRAATELSLLKAQENSSPFCILMADIDNFKAVNDTFGHNRGDDVIECVAGVLEKEIRITDKAVRWGVARSSSYCCHSATLRKQPLLPRVSVSPWPARFSTRLAR